MAARQALRAEWKQFTADPPGQRFERRYDRLRGGGPHRTALRIAAGLVLLVIGVVLLFIPGPGTYYLVIDNARIDAGEYTLRVEFQ